ncbi:MAG: penicillin-binding protein 2, partial [Serpentinimonas sp.]|nr:penicillin-binding protein 2 [Serpentinimonas sp.]
MTRAIAYSSSPLLTSKTPVWRSKLIVAGLAAAFLVLAARATYVQVVGNDFYQRQGEVRFTRTLDLPANRGRVLDRNGLILATSVEAQSVWAIPESVDRNHPKLAEAAKLLGINKAELLRRIGSNERT